MPTQIVNKKGVNQKCKIRGKMEDEREGGWIEIFYCPVYFNNKSIIDVLVIQREGLKEMDYSALLQQGTKSSITSTASPLSSNCPVYIPVL